MNNTADIQITSPTLDNWKDAKNLRLEALQNDALAFGGSYQKALKKSDFEWKNEIKQTLGDHPKELMIIAKDAERIVGMLGAFPKTVERWNLKGLYVTPDYRGKKISKQLVDEMVRQIDVRAKVKEIGLSVNIVNTTAVKLYQSMGFDIFDTTLGYEFGDGKTYDKYEMMKKIQ